jgi:hypothetical protein
MNVEKMSIFIPSQFFIPRQSLQLGRFVTDVDFLQEGHHDPSIDPPKCVVSPRSNFNGVQQNTWNRSFASALTSLMTVGFSKRAQAQVRIIAEQVKIYTLDNSDAWFETAVETSNTRRWIERQLEREKEMYMVVGFCTVTDARIVQHTAKDSQAKGQIGMPTALTLAAVTVVAPLGNLVDPTVGGTRQYLDSIQVQFVAPGEQICGVQYRKVRSGWLSSRAVDTLRLAKTQWSYYPTTVRCIDENDEDESEDDDAEAEEDDIIEVELEPYGFARGEWKVEELSGMDTLLSEASVNSARY